MSKLTRTISQNSLNLVYVHNAQDLVEYYKQFLQEDKRKSGNVMLQPMYSYVFGIRGQTILAFCQIYFSRKIGAPEFDRNVFIARKVNMT